MDYHEMMELGDELDQQFDELVQNCLISGAIDQGLYQKYDVKRGLRDSNGKGVLTGLTEISDVLATKVDADGTSHRVVFSGYQCCGSDWRKRKKAFYV